MDKYSSMIGKTYGRLTILGETSPKISPCGNRVRVAKCKCTCGKICEIRFTCIVQGYAKSCGCLAKEKLSQSHTTHGLSKSRLYKTWKAMIHRCYSVNSKHYQGYGSRGIRVCREWYNPDASGLELFKTGNPEFINFYNWAISNGYHDKPKGTRRGELLSIDRIDNNGPYAPWNCRWVTQDVQAENRRGVHYIEDLDGSVYTHSSFERHYGWKETTVHSRVDNGWTYDAIVYAAHHSELGLHKQTGIDNKFIDKDGFMVLIPSIELQKKWYNENH